MPSYTVYQVSLTTLLALITLTTANPQVAFPINSQLPPVAYVEQPFEFTFSPDTFTTEDNDISYALSKQPSWLSIDGSTRRLSGTPTLADRGAPSFDLVASDNSGQTTSIVTLVVLEESSLLPENTTLLRQLTNAGIVSAPSTLLLHPQQVFAFSFSDDLFNGTSEATVFYAVSSNGSPLPSWLQFDATTIHFSGTAPPLLEPNPFQQTFSFKVTASNVVGFSEASVLFEILIGDSLLAFVRPSLVFTVDRGSPFEIPSLLGNITIDGSTTRRDQIGSVQASPPSWLNLNETDLSFSGLVPESADTLSFSIAVSNMDTNTANATIMLQVSAGPLATQIYLGNVSAIGGSYFNYVVAPSFGFDNNTRITIDSVDLPDWLSFVDMNRTLHGLVPGNVSSDEQSLVFTFADDTHSASASLTLLVRQISPTAAGSPTSGTSTQSASTSSTRSASAASTASHAWPVILAVVLPLLALIFVIWAIVAWSRKRKQRRDQAKDQGFRHNPNTAMQESEPVPGDIPHVPGSVLPRKEVSPAVDDVPQVELSWPPDSISRARNRLSKRRKISHSSIVGSSWDDLIDFRTQSKDDLPQERYGLFKGRKDSDTLAILGPPAPRTAPKRPARPEIDHFHSFRASNTPKAKPTDIRRRSQHLSGAGHGARWSQNMQHSNPRSSWQTTMGTIPRADSRLSTVVMGSFPEPPSDSLGAGEADPDTSYLQPNQDQRSTLRLVESSSRESDSGDTGERNYHTRKARKQLEGSSRYPGVLSGAPSMSVFAEEATQSLDEIVPGPDRLKVNDVRPYAPPPLPRKSQVRDRNNSALSSTGRLQHASNQTMNREMSVASSHQFDSAVSSDSQWEDENLVSEENAAGEVYWHSEGDRTTSRPSPRLPFEPLRQAGRSRSENRTVLMFHKPRLADQRQPVTVESTELDRSERSQKGSFRFV